MNKLWFTLEQGIGTIKYNGDEIHVMFSSELSDLMVRW